MFTEHSYVIEFWYAQAHACDFQCNNIILPFFDELAIHFISLCAHFALSAPMRTTHSSRCDSTKRRFGISAKKNPFLLRLIYPANFNLITLSTHKPYTLHALPHTVAPSKCVFTERNGVKHFSPAMNRNSCVWARYKVSFLLSVKHFTFFWLRQRLIFHQRTAALCSTLPKSLKNPYGSFEDSFQ